VAVVAFVQARMSSVRFPGKVLAPFNGHPLISRVIDQALATKSLTRERIVVLTSTDPSDDPLDAYARRLGVEVFRGDLHDVHGRFRACARGRSEDWIVRINADSPLVSPLIIDAVVARAGEGFDLVTTIAPRTLPKGQNPEAIRRATLLATDVSALSASDREHVTPCYYRDPGRYRILSLKSDRPELAELNLSVDCIEDLRRLEAMSQRMVDDLLRVSLG
jgi:spore coat polysaccharide biosynthesis protein SpsF